MSILQELFQCLYFLFFLVKFKIISLSSLSKDIILCTFFLFHAFNLQKVVGFVIFWATVFYTILFFLIFDLFLAQIWIESILAEIRQILHKLFFEGIAKFVDADVIIPFLQSSDIIISTPDFIRLIM